MEGGGSSTCDYNSYPRRGKRGMEERERVKVVVEGEGAAFVGSQARQ